MGLAADNSKGKYPCYREQSALTNDHNHNKIRLQSIKNRTPSPWKSGFTLNRIIELFVAVIAVHLKGCYLCEQLNK